MLKWQKAAKPEELHRVKVIENYIVEVTRPSNKVRAEIKRLKAERSAIIRRCNVRGWRTKR
jgi:hypothetical protein